MIKIVALVGLSIGLLAVTGCHSDSRTAQGGGAATAIGGTGISRHVQKGKSGQQLRTWADAATGYSATLETCASGITPTAGYWPRCAGAARRKYKAAAAATMRYFGRLASADMCPQRAAAASKMVRFVSARFEAAWIATDRALASSRKRGGHSGSRRSLDWQTLLASADSAAQKLPRQTTQLTRALRRCGP